jgi:hypothetical protein
MRVFDRFPGDRGRNSKITLVANRPIGISAAAEVSGTVLANSV